MNARDTHPHFVPVNQADRRETAVLLVGTAEENDIDQHDIRSTSGGYYITDRLAEALGMDTSENEVDTSGVETDENATVHPGSPVPDGVQAEDVPPVNQDDLDSQPTSGRDADSDLADADADADGEQADPSDADAQQTDAEQTETKSSRRKRS